MEGHWRSVVVHHLTSEFITGASSALAVGLERPEGSHLLSGYFDGVLENDPVDGLKQGGCSEGAVVREVLEVAREEVGAVNAIGDVDFLALEGHEGHQFDQLL